MILRSECSETLSTVCAPAGAAIASVTASVLMKRRMKLSLRTQEGY
jgi:hypothetical protein